MPENAITGNAEQDIAFSDEEVATLAAWKESLDYIRYILEVRDRRTFNSEEIDQFTLSLRNIQRNIYQHQLTATFVTETISDDIRRITTPLYVAADTLERQNTPAGRGKGVYTQLDDTYDHLVLAIQHIPIGFPNNNDPTHFLEGLAHAMPTMKEVQTTLETSLEMFQGEPIWSFEIKRIIGHLRTIHEQLTQDRQRIDASRHLCQPLSACHWQVAQPLHAFIARVRDLIPLIMAFDMISDSKTRTRYTSLTEIQQNLCSALRQCMDIQSILQNNQSNILHLTMMEGDIP